MTAPGKRPRSTSALSVVAMRAKRCDDMPTSSGLARGSGSSAITGAATESMLATMKA
jgi:hypothetical protein